MSASYEQRKALVVEILEKDRPNEGIPLMELAEEILDALDHIPEKVDWVCQGQPRDQVTKGVA
jgi:hypothetical protein